MRTGSFKFKMISFLMTSLHEGILNISNIAMRLTSYYLEASAGPCRFAETELFIVRKHYEGKISIMLHFVPQHMEEQHR